MFVGFAMQTLATAATPDSVFVVKNGRIVSAYEVGTDVDNISFPKRIQLDGNCVKPAAVGEPLVAKERFAHHIGRQHRHQSLIAVRH